MAMLESRQVGIVSNHFQGQPRHNDSCGPRLDSLMSRIRHCVECPNCLTRYLIPCSPYRNGSYLIPTVEGCLDEYALYCACRKSTAASVCRWNEVKTCSVSIAAYDRGYGTPEEVVPIRSQVQPAWSFEAARYLNNLQSGEERRKQRPDWERLESAGRITAEGNRR